MAEATNRLLDRRARYGNLADIVDYSSKNEGNQVFYQYRSKTKIGKKIFEELYSRFNNDASKGDIGFYMDDTHKVGLLSQCHSLQALMLLASSFKLDFDDAEIIKNGNLTIREVMDIVMDDILARIETDDPNKYLFDATPYVTPHFTVETANVEAITWVLSCFLQILKYHASIREKCRRQERLVAAISYGMRYLNESFIKGESELGKSKKLEIGWNFTNGCEEPSLYYTFTVCECLVEIFKTFEEYLTYLKEKRKFDKYSTSAQNTSESFEALKESYEELEEKFNEHIAEFEKINAATANDVEENIDPEAKRASKYDTYNELRLRFIEINGGVAEIAGEYGKLEDNCKKVAHEIWRLSKDRLAEAFFYNDLDINTTITENDISMATTSDALFNTVYMINIMLDAGVDEDIDTRREFAKNEEELEAALREYNDMLDSCQLAVQKAFRTYEKLKNDGKEYIVDQFLVGFNEKFTRHKVIIKELRKLRMRVFSLMPLLIRTNNAISEYLVKYPQHNMRKYLGYILENRYEKNGSVKWIWEKDGFFSCSNYYFISALGEFYSYYERYESEYIENYNKNKAQREAILAEQKRQDELPEGEIGKRERLIDDKNNEIKELQLKNAELQQALDNVERPVESAVIDIVKREVGNMFPELITAYIASVAANVNAATMGAEELDESNKAFQAAMGAFFMSLVSEKVYSASKSSKASFEENKKAFERFQGYIRKDIQLLVSNYIARIKNSSDHESSLFE